jgi:hypothetical protein
MISSILYFTSFLLTVFSQPPHSLEKALKSGAEAVFQKIPDLEYVEQRSAQDLIEAERQSDPSIRDRKLLESINFASEALPYDKALWQEVLQARYLYCQTLDCSIKAYQKHFMRDNCTLQSQIKEKFNAYFEGRKQLEQLPPEATLSLQLSQAVLLNQLLQELQSFKDETFLLATATNKYALRIADYLEDAQNAEEHFYALDGEIMQNLKHNLLKLNELNTNLFTSKNSMYAICEELESFAKAELNTLRAKNQLTSSEVEEQKISSLFRLMPNYVDINEQLTSIFSDNIKL